MDKMFSMLKLATVILFANKKSIFGVQKNVSHTFASSMDAVDVDVVVDVVVVVLVEVIGHFQ